MPPFLFFQNELKVSEDIVPRTGFFSEPFLKYFDNIWQVDKGVSTVGYINADT
jgi:hypothetical protein